MEVLTGNHYPDSMDIPYLLPHRKQPASATVSTAAAPDMDAVLEEVRQLRAAIAVYRKIVDRLMQEKAA